MDCAGRSEKVSRIFSWALRQRRRRHYLGEEQWEARLRDAAGPAVQVEVARGRERPALGVRLPAPDTASLGRGVPCMPMQTRHAEPIYCGKRCGRFNAPGGPGQASSPSSAPRPRRWQCSRGRCLHVSESELAPYKFETEEESAYTRAVGPLHLTPFSFIWRITRGAI
jgi:hypothetical protein